MATYFEPDGDRFVPTGVTRGPWDPTAMNGGPVAMLVARSAERHDADGAARMDGHVLARLTVDLVRPVPLTPLTVRTTTLKPGRRIQVVEVVLEAGGEVVTRGVGLRMPAAHPGFRPEPAPPPPGPDDIDVADRRSGPAEVAPPEAQVFHVHGTELRVAAGDDRPKLIWARLPHDLLPGEPVSPAARAAAISDYPSGMTGVQVEGWRSINADITTSLVRQPVGEWIGLLAQSHSYAGVGLAEAELYDTTGRVGRSVQSVLVEPWRRLG